MDRVIWQYWETVGKKPRFVDGLHDLASRNAGVKVIQVTPETLSDFLPEVPHHIFEIRELAHKADMLRALLIREHGGMWLDSDAIVLKDLNPLFDWLDDAEFVGFNDDGRLAADRPWVRVNCFLSRPGGRVITDWVTAQHAKFPKVVYDWEEVGSALLNPICLDKADTVKILPFETICPVRWDEVERFSSTLRSARPVIDDVIMIMLSNKALGDRNPGIREKSVEEMARTDDLLGQFVKRAIDASYMPPGRLRLMYRRIRSWLSKRWNRARFDNRDFWNERYANDPEKGSGPGSRDENAALKRSLIEKSIVKYGATSILDLGCGDAEVVSGIDLPNYHGIDLSDVVVERNQRARPDLTFTCGSIGDLPNSLTADLVLCLDVLIHQKTQQDYDAILAGALRSADKVALISGYQDPPEGWNVFFHEALDQSISRLDPAATVTHIAAYRDTDLFEVRKAD